MKILTRDQILAASDIQTVPVDVPEWGGSVLVRGMTGLERDNFEQEIVSHVGKKTILKWENVRAKTVALCVVDDQGRRIFEESDIEALGQKSAAALERVFDAARRLSGLSDSDVEELAKN